MEESIWRKALWGGYNILLGGGALVASPLLAYKVAATPRWRVGWEERVALELPPEPQGEPVFWIHAVSVGEVMAVSPLVKALREKYPQASIYLSTVTETGKETVLERVGRYIDHHLFLPLDWAPLVGRVVRRICPQLFALVETEIWPNLLRSLALKGTQVVLVNGRISPSSFEGYGKAQPLLRHVWRYFQSMAMQSPRDAARILALGAPNEKVVVAGNLKYDQAILQLEEVDPREVLERFRLSRDEEVIVAGSTHPGEEELILDAFVSLRGEFPHLTLLLAPRHPRRRDEVESVLRDRGMAWVLRTQIEERKGEPVILLDTLGELAAAYSVARIALVGGSWIDRGGHNPLEPAFFAKSILMGPSYFNFVDMVEDLRRGGGIRVVAREDLEKEMRAFLADEGKASSMGERARGVLLRNKGALDRHMELIQTLLSGGPEEAL